MWPRAGAGGKKSQQLQNTGRVALGKHTTIFFTAWTWDVLGCVLAEETWWSPVVVVDIFNQSREEITHVAVQDGVTLFTYCGE